jgi:hypothetical protein
MDIEFAGGIVESSERKCDLGDHRGFAIDRHQNRINRKLVIDFDGDIGFRVFAEDRQYSAQCHAANEADRQTRDSDIDDLDWTHNNRDQRYPKEHPEEHRLIARYDLVRGQVRIHFSQAECGASQHR